MERPHSRLVGDVHVETEQEGVVLPSSVWLLGGRNWTDSCEDPGRNLASKPNVENVTLSGEVGTVESLEVEICGWSLLEDHVESMERILRQEATAALQNVLKDVFVDRNGANFLPLLLTPNPTLQTN